MENFVRFVKAGKMVRDGLLALPDRLVDLLAAESDPATVRKTLLDELEEVLNKLGG